MGTPSLSLPLSGKLSKLEEEEEAGFVNEKGLRRKEGMRQPPVVSSSQMRMKSIMQTNQRKPPSSRRSPRVFDLLFNSPFLGRCGES